MIGVLVRLQWMQLKGRVVRSIRLLRQPKYLVGFIVGAGWKPGFSSDYDAVALAKRIKAKRIINLSNTDYVYSDDPKKDPKAKRHERMTWKEYLGVIGDHWVPGRNSPFDPVAAKLCAKERLEVAVVSGEDLTNVERALRGADFKGTLIR